MDPEISVAREPGRTKLPGRGWWLLLGAVAVLVVALRAGAGANAHGYPIDATSAGFLAELKAAARQWSAIAALVGVAVVAPWRLGSRAWIWSALLVIPAWAWWGYKFNRFQVANLWQEKGSLAGISVPAAMVDPPTLARNLGASVLAALIVVALAWVLRRWSPRLWPVPVPRWSFALAVAVWALLAACALRPATALRATPRGPDLVLISLDAVRADRLGCYGYERDITPNLDAFAATATRFSRAYAQEPWTLTSHMTMLTSLYPDAHGLDFGRSLDPSVWTLPEQLREAGYRTWGSVYDCFLLDPRFGYHAGFDSYDVNGSAAMPRAKAAANWLLQSDRPGFVFLHFYDPHSDTGSLPYEAGEEYQRRFAPGAAEQFDNWPQPTGASETLRRVNEEGLEFPPALREATSRLYDAGLAETDAAVGAFLDRLRQAGRLDNALVMILADHGEALGERDHFMHEELMDATLRIPLLVRWPQNQNAPQVRTDLAETTDVTPTFLAAAGVGPRDIVQGFDLAQPTPRQYSLHRSGPRYALSGANGWRLLYRWQGETILLDQLRRIGESPADGPDQLESNLPVADAFVDAATDLRRANQLLSGRLGGGAVTMTGADEELLRSLGYIE